MSFITQCPSCATKFKITQEQLSVSEGWVRCGRCDHIFDSSDYLIKGPTTSQETAAAPDAPLSAPTPSTRPDPAAPTEADLSPPSSPAHALMPAADSANLVPASTQPDEPLHDASEAIARPSERWLKELSETFTPTELQSAQQLAHESEAAQADSSDSSDSQSALVASLSPSDSFLSDPSPAEQTAHEPADPVRQLAATEPLPSNSEPAKAPVEDANTATDASDIDRFQAELAQWKTQQAHTTQEWPEPDSAQSIYTDGSASPVLLQESAATPPSQDHARPPNSGAAAEPENKVDNKAESAAIDPEEEERLERYREEFSETQELRFMRDAEHKAFWRRPVIRTLMACLALLLLALLAAQWTYVQRDTIAATSPQWKARMQQACTWLNCHIKPLQSIGELVLDGSTFQHDGENRYTLSWTVRNRSQRWLETPSLSLSLRNAAGQVLVRRTIPASRMPQAPAELPPSGAWQAQQHLVLTDYANAITGYQLQIFYPDAP